jgi:hypothetical protein
MKATLVLRVGQGTIDAQLMRRRRVLWVGAAPYTVPDDIVQAIAQLAGEATLPIRPTGLQVTIEPPLVQIRMLRGLPPVRRRALRSLVALQAGRFFRRNGQPLITDVAWEGGASGGRGRIVGRGDCGWGAGGRTPA